jgi:hypothetical protein
MARDVVLEAPHDIDPPIRSVALCYLWPEHFGSGTAVYVEANATRLARILQGATF